MEWKDKEPQPDQWTPKYYKGLATHDPTEAKGIFKNMKLQKYSWNDLSRIGPNGPIGGDQIHSDHVEQPQPCDPDTDAGDQMDTDADTDAGDQMDQMDQDDDSVTQCSTTTDFAMFDNYYKDAKSHPCDLAMELAFNKKKADYRKGWITQYLKKKVNGQIDLDLHKLSTMSYYDFINEKFIDFSVYDNERSIPSLVDGLKPSQRKIVYTMFKKSLKKDVKVSELAGVVSAETLYHHGQVSLEETIIGLAQDFTGSNNINLLIPKGQFGSRLGIGGTGAGVGKDSGAPRYIHTNFNSLGRVIFNKIDENVYQYIDDDGKLVEPKFYVPVIPMVLVNGANGIGTGWSTDVPCYNPSQIIRNIESFLNGQPMEEMTPWYRGYAGTITKTRHQRYISTGVYRRTGPSTIEITELPVGNSKSTMC